MEISIKYLVPLLVVFNNKNYFCMVDYGSGNLYFLNEPDDTELKIKLEKEILRKVDTSAVKDFQGEVTLNSSISSIIRDINNNDFFKKYNKFDVNKEQEEESKNNE